MNKQASELLKIARDLMAAYGDPYWLMAKYPSRCAKCGHPIAKGERSFYYPRTKKLYGEKCGHGEEAATDFRLHAQDEDMFAASSRTAKKLAAVEDVPFKSIKRGQRFTYKGKLWERTRGAFGIPVDDIGQGQVGWPIKLDTMVTPASPKLAASSIRVGDICRMDRSKALRGESGSSESAKMVKRIWDRADGWVEVLEVNGGMAKVTQRQYGSGTAKLMTSVPLDSLDNSMKRFDTPKELGKAVGLNESMVSEFLTKGDFPVMQGDMNWRYLLQEKKISQQIVDESDRRDSGPEL